MAAQHRVHRLAGAKADPQILFRQVELRFAIRQEGHLAGIALIQVARRVRQPRLGLQVEDIPVEFRKPRHIARDHVHMMQLQFHGILPP